MVRRLLFVMVGLVVAILTSGCGASVDASKTRSQAVIDSGGIVPADELRVAEYVSYYKQNFPAPVNSTLGLDLRLGNTQVPSSGGDAWLQIGIQARSADSDIVAPLNLAIVVDKSGSMDDPNKMPLVKQSLRAFLHGLSPTDLVALVSFDDQVDVLRGSSEVGDGTWIDGIVDRLQPGGGTNLNAGLTAGFQEVDRHFDLRRNNRVIVLTDGVANQGVTDPDQIAAGARAFNDKGIYLSTIGLGNEEFNDALLIRLANQGKGAYHFIGSAEDLDKIFHQDLVGLLQKAAENVSITIQPESDVTIDSLTGYNGRPPSGPIRIALRDMGTGDSQVVLAHLTVTAGQTGSRRLATVQLGYHDLFATRDVSTSKPVAADSARLSSYDPTWDAEVLRNVTIQRTAEGIKEIDLLYQAKRYLDAWRLANGLEHDLRNAAQIANDPQLVKDADTMRTYEDTLAKWVQQQTGKLPDEPRSTTPGADSQSPGPTPSVATLDIQ